MKLTRLLAIVALILSCVFWAVHFTNGLWCYQFMMLLGLTLWCISDFHDKIP